MESAQELRYQSHIDHVIDPRRTESSSLPARRTQFGFTIAKPISLLVLHRKGQDFYFHVSQAATSYLETLDGVCYVISVSGNPLVGKSFLFNLLLSFFTCSNNGASQENIHYQELYPTGDGKRSTTEGVDMYCLSFNGKNFIFLDIEGDNDPSRKGAGVWIYTNLLQTAVGASHVHFYNYNGLPQEYFLDYFESIPRMIKQNHVHPKFEVQYAFLKRNDSISEFNLQQETEGYQKYCDEKLGRDNLHYSSYLLPIPPQHLIEKKSQTSCIALTGVLCKECQSHLFTTILLDLFNKVNDYLGKIAPFESGNQVSRVFEQIVEINQKDFPFFLDEGYISKIRLDAFKNEQIRIQAGLLEVKNFHARDNHLFSQEIQRIINDHPHLVDNKVCETLGSIQMFLVTRISQMEFIIPELSKFIEQYLLDDRASILNEKEKETLWETYIIHFDILTKDIISSLKEYYEATKFICKDLSDLNTETEATLTEYKSAESSAIKHAVAFLSELASSGSLLSYFEKEGLTKGTAALAAGEIVGGIYNGALTAYFFIQAYQKMNEAMKRNEASLDSKKISGIDDVKGVKEKVKKIEEFVITKVHNLEEYRETLKDVCSGGAHENFNLIESMKNIMDKKLSGASLSTDLRANLIEGMKAAKDNLERFKKCF